MRFAHAFLVTLLCITMTSTAHAKDVSWSVKISEDSPLARFAAIDGGTEILSIACVKSNAPDSALEESRALVRMKSSHSLAILVRDQPAEGKSARLNLEYLDEETTIARTQMAYVDNLGAYYTELDTADGLVDLLMGASAIRFIKSRPNERYTELDFPREFRQNLASMADEHCHSNIAKAIRPGSETAARESVAQKIDWGGTTALSSREDVFFLLRRWGENGLITQLSDGSGQAEATLFTLDEKKSLSPNGDFLIDAENRYFFRAGHSTKGRALASLKQNGDLSLLTTDDSFARSLSDAAPLGDDWILAAGGLFHLSAKDELSNLSTTPASGRFPAHLTNVGGRVLYIDKHPEYGVELFATDGTVEGTGMLVDINDRVYRQGRTRDSGPALEHAARIGERIVFTATDASIPSGGARSDQHIWSSDGTAEGTFRLPTDGFYSSFSNFVEFEGRLYVTARTRGKRENVLYSTDGTAEGTRALASARSLVKAAGGEPEKVRSLLGEPTRIGTRLIVPLLGSPLGRERGNPLFEVSANGELKHLSETSENIGDLSSRLRQTGISAGGMLLYVGTAVKESTTFQGKSVSTVIRAVDPDSGDTNILYELRSVERVAWTPSLPGLLPAIDAVAFGTRIGSGRNIIVTDGTTAGTRSLSQVANPEELPKIGAFAIGSRRIVWIERDVFFSFEPGQEAVKTLFDPMTTKESRPGNAILGTVRVR